MIQKIQNIIQKIFSNQSLLSDQISRKHTDILSFAFGIGFVFGFGVFDDFGKTFWALFGFWVFSFLGWLSGFLLGIYELQNKESIKKN